MITPNYNRLKNVYDLLCEHRDYWEFDNDYKSKFRIIADTVEHWDSVTYESKIYVMDLSDFMLKASARIFKHGVPVFAANGNPIDDDKGIIDFSR